MALAVKTTPIEAPFDYDMTELLELANAVTSEVRDLRNGPATLRDIAIDNTVTAATKSYVKLYDVIDATFVAGTSKPRLILPVAPYVDQHANGREEIGYIHWICPEGLPFRNGISALASQEDGNEMAAAPAQDVDVYLMSN